MTQAAVAIEFINTHDIFFIFQGATAVKTGDKEMAGWPSVFEYVDFRKFLHEYQQARHTINKSFTASFICLKLGLPNTRSYFRDVVNGKKITTDYVERFIRVFGMDREEAQFFRVLVQLDQAEATEQKELLFEQLVMLNRTPKAILNRNAFLFYSGIHHSVIRALLDIHDFRGNYSDIAKKMRPPLKPQKIRELIRLMKGLGLIKRDGKGCWKPTDKAITTEAYVQDKLIKHYQAQMHRNGERSAHEKR